LGLESGNHSQYFQCARQYKCYDFLLVLLRS